MIKRSLGKCKQKSDSDDEELEVGSQVPSLLDALIELSFKFLIFIQHHSTTSLTGSLELT